MRIYCIFIILFMVFLGCNNHDGELEEEILKGEKKMDSIRKESKFFEQFKKYSYFIKMPISGVDFQQATGFFVSLQADTFFISNYHVFTNQNVTLKKPFEDKWDSLMVRYVSTETNKVAYYSIDISGIKRSMPFINSYDSPDIYAYKCADLPNDMKIYSVDVFFDNVNENILNKSEVFFWGFPGYNAVEGHNSNELYLSRADLVNPLYSTHYIRDLIGMHNCNFMTKITPTGFGGMSGSPVFFKVGNKAVFGGVYSMSYPAPYNFGFFVNASKLFTHKGGPDIKLKP